MSQTRVDTAVPTEDTSTKTPLGARNVPHIPAARSARLAPGPSTPVETARPARLVINRGPEAGTGIPITAPVTTIGRQRDRDVVFDEVTVSRRHAEITYEADRYVLVDGGSLNGTYVNRTPVDRVELVDGDEIWIGKIRFLFRTDGL